MPEHGTQLLSNHYCALSQMGLALKVKNPGQIWFGLLRIIWLHQMAVPNHSMFLEWWNTAKSLPNIWQRTAKIYKKFNSHDGFLRADQGRAKNCCHIGWIGCPILQVAQKVDMKNIFKDFLLYFTTLER